MEVDFSEVRKLVRRPGLGKLQFNFTKLVWSCSFVVWTQERELERQQLANETDREDAPQG